jgi:hypothetical protein
VADQCGLRREDRTASVRVRHPEPEMRSNQPARIRNDDVLSEIDKLHETFEVLVVGSSGRAHDSVNVRNALGRDDRGVDDVLPVGTSVVIGGDDLVTAAATEDIPQSR